MAGSGKYAGTVAFRREEALGHKLFTDLDPRYREQAVIADTMPEELFVGAFRDNGEVDHHARLRMQKVLAHEGDTHFARAGDPDGTFCYRLHSPVILVEFEHMPGVIFGNDHHLRRHIHTIVRTRNAGDYGVDLLRQHHERHHRGGPREPMNKETQK